MTCKDSHFLIGLGIGSIFGALAYGFARSARAKKMKAEVFDALHRIEGHTECLIESAKEKALYAGEKVADRVANETSVIAEKANDIKGTLWLMKLRSNQSVHYRKNRGRRGITYTLSVFHYILVIEWASLTNEAG